MIKANFVKNAVFFLVFTLNVLKFKILYNPNKKFKVNFGKRKIFKRTNFDLSWK